MTTTPRRLSDRDVRACRAAGEHVRATRHTRAECFAHAADISAAVRARNEAWTPVLEAERVAPGSPEHTAALAVLAAARAEEARVRAGEPLPEPDLTRVRLTKTDHGPGEAWHVWIPHRGPLVEHVPFVDRYDVGVTSDADLTDDDRAAWQDVALMDPFGDSYWPTFEEAREFLVLVERQYPRPVASSS
ncbi:hypothetical protein ACFCZ3_20105 [Cellulosimicrobium cellulans]|uniref:hypothetical protein n=1 Tax=Cellulosimicrobium cellulans TaxID=1710 RepID=UPI0035DD52CD